MKSRGLLGRGLLVLSVAMIWMLPLSFAAFAQIATTGYKTDSTILRGSLISVSKDDKNKVELVNKDDIDRMFGVVVNSNDAAVTLVGEDQEAFVATTGALMFWSVIRTAQ